MMAGPIKLVFSALIIGAVASTVLAIKFEDSSAEVASRSRAQDQGTSDQGASAGSSQSFFERWFGGIEFRGPQDEEKNPANASPRQSSARDTPGMQTPAPSAASGFGSVALNADASGHYTAQVEIDGQTMPMLVDTGATIVALRHEDAMNLGIQAAPGDFTARMSTANGQILAARKRLREVRVENITVTDVDAVIMPPGALAHSLLGMSFLRKLASFEIASGQLILKP